MDEPHLLAALRYVAMNPVRAQDWRWSSVNALLYPAKDDGITDTAQVHERVPDFAALLAAGDE